MPIYLQNSIHKFDLTAACGHWAIPALQFTVYVDRSWRFFLQRKNVSADTSDYHEGIKNSNVKKICAAPAAPWTEIRRLVLFKQRWAGRCILV